MKANVYKKLSNSIAALICCAGMMLTSASAQDITWNGAAQDGLWGTTNNWVGNVAPGIPSKIERAIIGSTTNLTIVNDQTAPMPIVNRLRFASGSASVTLAGAPLQVDTEIENLSTNTQIIANSIVSASFRKRGAGPVMLVSSNNVAIAGGALNGRIILTGPDAYLVHNSTSGGDLFNRDGNAGQPFLDILNGATVHHAAGRTLSNGPGITIDGEGSKWIGGSNTLNFVSANVSITDGGAITNVGTVQLQSNNNLISLNQAAFHQVNHAASTREFNIYSSNNKVSVEHGSVLNVDSLRSYSMNNAITLGAEESEALSILTARSILLGVTYSTISNSLTIGSWGEARVTGGIALGCSFNDTGYANSIVITNGGRLVHSTRVTGGDGMRIGGNSSSNNWLWVGGRHPTNGQPSIWQGAISGVDLTTIDIGRAGAASKNNRLIIADGGIVTNITPQLGMSANNGSRFNSKFELHAGGALYGGLIVGHQAQDCHGFIYGGESFALLNGLGKSVSVGSQANAVDNTFMVDGGGFAGGALITNATINIGYLSDVPGSRSTNNQMTVRNGAHVFVINNTQVGYTAHRNNHSVTNSQLDIDGALTRWDNGGKEMRIGYADASSGAEPLNHVYGSLLRVTDDAIVSNISYLRIGHAEKDYARTICNQAEISNGATLSAQNATIGRHLTNNDDNGNRLIVANGNLLLSGTLYIGQSLGRGAFVVEGSSGTIQAAGLAVIANSTLEYGIDGAGIIPTEITGNVSFGADIKALPRMISTTPCVNEMPVITWTGTATGLENVTLSDEAAESGNWRLTQRDKSFYLRHIQAMTTLIVR